MESRQPDLQRPPHAPSGFDPNCRTCDLNLHVCPGCGDDVPHGRVACEVCNPFEGMTDCSVCGQAVGTREVHAHAD